MMKHTASEDVWSITVKNIFSFQKYWKEKKSSPASTSVSCLPTSKYESAGGQYSQSHSETVTIFTQNKNGSFVPLVGVKMH